MLLLIHVIKKNLTKCIIVLWEYTIKTGIHVINNLKLNILSNQCITFLEKKDNIVHEK